MKKTKSDLIDDYALLFGSNDLIPEAWFSSKKYKSIEEVYAECIKKHVTWRKLTGWNEDKKKDTLL